jgi:histidinol dehydrogenase
MSASPSAVASVVRWQGAIHALGASDRRALFDRTTSGDASVRDRTAAIIERVRRDGDAALRAMPPSWMG